ncbi:MAG: NAD(P)H-dependent oxidoreductase [Lachnospiraceae bacterium]|nr:NAD(P)H-dependent oxidoreductase [Lachnospiraceae bacterium]
MSLRECTVNPCKACYACFKTGKCVQKDDMAEILNKVKNADVLVLASPMMKQIASLREKYDLHMSVERYVSSGDDDRDNKWIRK